MPDVDVIERRLKTKKIQTNASLRRDFGSEPHLNDQAIVRGLPRRCSRCPKDSSLRVLVCRAVCSILVTVDYFQVSSRLVYMVSANSSPAHKGRHRHPHRRRTSEATTNGAVADSTEKHTSSEARITEW